MNLSTEVTKKMVGMMTRIPKNITTCGLYHGNTCNPLSTPTWSYAYVVCVGTMPVVKALAHTGLAICISFRM